MIRKFKLSFVLMFTLTTILITSISYGGMIRLPVWKTMLDLLPNSLFVVLSIIMVVRFKKQVFNNIIYSVIIEAMSLVLTIFSYKLITEITGHWTILGWGSTDINPLWSIDEFMYILIPICLILFKTIQYMYYKKKEYEDIKQYFSTYIICSIGIFIIYETIFRAIFIYWG